MEQNNNVRADVKVSVAIFNQYLDQVILKWNPAEPKYFPEKGKKINKPEGWGMPGGVQEPTDEDEIDCGVREAKEETGLRVEIIEPTKLRFVEDMGDHIRITLVGRIMNGKMKADCKWVSLNRSMPFQTYGGHWRKILQMRELIEQLGLKSLWK